MMNANPFRIRVSLKSALPNKKRKKGSKNNSTTCVKNNHVLTITPSMSISELERTIHDIFDSNDDSKDYDIELYNSFPPKVIDCGDPTALVSTHIQSGENVIVKYVEKKKLSSNVNTTKKATNRKRARRTQSTNEGNDEEESHATLSVQSDTTEKTSSIRGRPKRAAANIASASFKKVIKEQDKILKSERAASSRTSLKTKIKNSNFSSQSTNTNDKKRKAAAEARAAAANSRRLASLPGGRTLNGTSGDTNSIGVHTDEGNQKSTIRTNSKARNTAPNVFKGMKSEEDISFALLSSVNTPGSGRKVTKVLRSAMRRTVEKSYEASRAVVRCSAIASGDIYFSKQSSSKTIQQQGTCNDIGTYSVKYPKGIEGTGYYEDENIHIISIETLKAVIQSVYETDEDSDDDSKMTGEPGREMLKPNNMALLSPRVFWSLWYHYREQCQSIEEILETILPDLKWKFLYKRSRQLSEKAKENLRQMRREQGLQVVEDNDYEGKEIEASIDAVKIVEDAMENMNRQSDRASLTARTAEAALFRLKSQNDKKSIKRWNFVNTPTEVDTDELKECIEEAMVSDDTEFTPEQVDACVRYMVSNLSINNWRMLADADIKNISAKMSLSISHINEVFVAKIVTAAQQRSMEEIMLEIVNGNEDIYQILREEASSATPKDLSLWKMIPTVLLEEVPLLLSEYKVSEQQIIDWCHGAEIAIETYEWLSEFSTSIL